MMGSVAINNAGIAGWPGAVVMGNGLVSVVVVPEAARILSMRHGSTDFLFANRGEFGRTYSSPHDAGEWHNFGGIRFDVAPQGRWAETSWRRDWPPPPVLNTPRTLHRTGDGVLMKSAAESNDLDLGIEAYVRLVEGSTIVAVDQSITNIGRVPSCWANWAIAQLAASMGNSIMKGNSVAFVPPAPDSKHGRGYLIQMDGPASNNPIVVNSGDDPIKIRYNGSQWKFGFDRRNWIAFRPFEFSSLLFVMVGKYDPQAVYPDDDSSVEYYAAGHMPYVELESLGPLVTLEADAKRFDPFRFAVTNANGPVLGVTNVGVVTNHLELGNGAIFGGFGVFYSGTARLTGTSKDGREMVLADFEVSPDRPFELDRPLKERERYKQYRVDVYDLSRKRRGVLDILNNEGN